MTPNQVYTEDGVSMLEPARKAYFRFMDVVDDILLERGLESNYAVIRKAFVSSYLGEVTNEQAIETVLEDALQNK